ncbi:MAG: aldo/keto reductase, partial [Actinophytocola sp.]
ARHDVGPDAVALAAVLTVPWADTVLLGPAGPAQLRSNLAALTVRGAASLPYLAVEPAEYWAARAALAWS